MINIKLAIILLSCLLVATLVHASSESRESSGEKVNINNILNKLPSNLKNLADALPLKQISDALSSKNGGGNPLLLLVLGLIQLLLTVLSLPLALVGIVLTLVFSILGSVIMAVLAILRVL